MYLSNFDQNYKGKILELPPVLYQKSFYTFLNVFWKHKYLIIFNYLF